MAVFDHSITSAEPDKPVCATIIGHTTLRGALEPRRVLRRRRNAESRTLAVMLLLQRRGIHHANIQIDPFRGLNRRWLKI